MTLLAGFVSGTYRNKEMPEESVHLECKKKTTCQNEPLAALLPSISPRKWQHTDVLKWRLQKQRDFDGHMFWNKAANDVAVVYEGLSFHSVAKPSEMRWGERKCAALPTPAELSQRRRCSVTTPKVKSKIASIASCGDWFRCNSKRWCFNHSSVYWRRLVSIRCPVFVICFVFNAAVFVCSGYGVSRFGSPRRRWPPVTGCHK